MAVFLFSNRRPYRIITAALLILLTLDGCAMPPSASRAGHAAALQGPTASTVRLPEQPSRRNPAHLIPAIRYGRYTVVELSPDVGQQDLMQQIVEVTIPARLAATLGDALRYVLLRSGFTLCERSQIRILNTLPLPAADLHLGPLTLETALRILVGPAWKLEVNEMTRRVCFLPVSPLPTAGVPARFGPPAARSPQHPARPMAKPADFQP